MTPTNFNRKVQQWDQTFVLEHLKQPSQCQAAGRHRRRLLLRWRRQQSRWLHLLQRSPRGRTQLKQAWKSPLTSPPSPMPAVTDSAQLPQLNFPLLWHRHCTLLRHVTCTDVVATAVHWTHRKSGWTKDGQAPPTFHYCMKQKLSSKFPEPFAVEIQIVVYSPLKRNVALHCLKRWAKPCFHTWAIKKRHHILITEL